MEDMFDSNGFRITLETETYSRAVSLVRRLVEEFPGESETEERITSIMLTAIRNACTSLPHETLQPDENLNDSTQNKITETRSTHDTDSNEISWHNMFYALMNELSSIENGYDIVKAASTESNIDIVAMWHEMARQKKEKEIYEGEQTTIDEQLELMKAFKDGKTVRCGDIIQHVRNPGYCLWHCCEMDHLFDFSHNYYKIEDE